LGSVYRETEVERADLGTIIADLLLGQFNDPIRVVAFNTLEHWSQDVSEGIAAEIQSRCDIDGTAVPEHKTSLQAVRVRIASSPAAGVACHGITVLPSRSCCPTDGVKLASLREAIAHLVKTIPSSDRGMPAVLTAAEAAEHDGPVGLRVLLRCGQSIATLSGCLTPRAKTRIGDAAS
jgi:hypothetical protein